MENGESLIDSNQIFKEWVELYSDQLYSWAFYKTSSKETAEDLVQDTFIAAIQGYANFENRSNIKTWLISILKNKIYDYHRKKIKGGEITNTLISDIESSKVFFDQSEEWILSERPTGWGNMNENLLDDKEFTRTLQNCLENLPSHWNYAIQLKYLTNKDGKTICQELGISPSNFWQILHRAKLQLRKCLEKNWFIKE